MLRDGGVSCPALAFGLRPLSRALIGGASIGSALAKPADATPGSAAILSSDLVLHSRVLLGVRKSGRVGIQIRAV